MSRSRIEEFSSRFAALHADRCDLARSTSEARLFAVSTNANVLWPRSAATLLVRSAAVVEKMINGLTVRLWDDPFEWTLPEHLRTSSDLTAYFDEVENARVRGFEFLNDDADLERSILSPVKLKTLEQLLADTIAGSETYLAEAESMVFTEKAAS